MIPNIIPSTSFALGHGKIPTALGDNRIYYLHL